MSLGTLLANIQHAVSTGNPTTIGGGVFSPAELRAAAGEIKTAIEDAIRWRAIFTEVDEGRIDVTIINTGDGVSEGELITDGGDLNDHINTLIKP